MNIFDDDNDWFNLKACQIVWAYFMPRGQIYFNIFLRIFLDFELSAVVCCWLDFERQICRIKFKFIIIFCGITLFFQERIKSNQYGDRRLEIIESLSIIIVPKQKTHELIFTKWKKKNYWRSYLPNPSVRAGYDTRSIFKAEF